jgi:hypothetical protein
MKSSICSQFTVFDKLRGFGQKLRGFEKLLITVSAISEEVV